MAAGVIVPAEIERLRAAGVTIFSPQDGQRLGLPGMVNQVVQACDTDLWAEHPTTAAAVISGERSAVARAITAAETGQLDDDLRGELERAAAARHTPVLGITGTGGSGKSSLTDELVRRLRVDQQDKLRVACVAIDPTRRRGGGALLGDRIRMNSLDGDRVYFRSLATRGGREVPEALGDVLTILKAAGFDLVVVETPGIGQGDAAITSFADVNLYVMTPEFGAASQLEKIDMLDFADVVAINKFERRGAMDALRDVGRQMVRNRGAFGKKPDDMPVFGTSAATFNDDGVTALYQELRGLLAEAGLEVGEGALAPVSVRHSSVLRQVVPPQRVRYLAEIAETVRGYHDDTRRYAEAARRVQRLTEVGARARAGRVRPGRRRRAARPAPRTTCRCRSPASSPAGRPSSRPTRATSRSSPCATRRSTPLWCGSRCPATGSAGSRCLATPTTATSCRSCAARTSPATSRSPPASSRSSATTRTPRGCSPARATRSAPTPGSRCSRRASPPPGCRRRSTR